METPKLGLKPGIEVVLNLPARVRVGAILLDVAFIANV
jgi:hypothetical protein